MDCRRDGNTEPSTDAGKRELSSSPSAENEQSQSTKSADSLKDLPGGLSRQGVDDACAGVFDDPSQIDMLIQQMKGRTFADLEDWSVKFVAAGMCQNHDDATKCEACVREIIEFASGQRIHPTTPPSDAELRRLFKDQHAVFTTLRDMILSEGVLVGIGTDFLCFQPPSSRHPQSFWLHDDGYEGQNGQGFSRDELLRKIGMTQARYGEYLQLLEKIGAYRLTRPSLRPDLHPVCVKVYRYGNVASSLCKDIEFFSPEHFSDGVGQYRSVVECTDDMPDESDWYAPLGGGWCIHFSRS